MAKYRYGDGEWECGDIAVVSWLASGDCGQDCAEQPGGMRFREGLLSRDGILPAIDFDLPERVACSLYMLIRSFGIEGLSFRADH